MRPLQLKLKGINSYREEQVIDFETLTSQGLFGIFGPTGSGKSTILDAMTLALYAKLPRDTKNFINTNETTASVSFLFSITTDRTRKYLLRGRGKLLHPAQLGLHPTVRRRRRPRWYRRSSPHCALREAMRGYTGQRHRPPMFPDPSSG